MNSMDLQDGEAKDIYGVFLINSVLPFLVALVSFSIYRTSVSLYLSKLSEAMSQIEMKNILKIIPQALFFVDEAHEEVLHQSDAMTSFFGQSVEKILPAKIFSVKETNELNKTLNGKNDDNFQQQSQQLQQSNPADNNVLDIKQMETENQALATTERGALNTE